MNNTIESFRNSLGKLCQRLSDSNHGNHDNYSDIEDTSDCVTTTCEECRQLRNACAQSKDTQNLLHGEEAGSNDIFEQLQHSTRIICQVLAQQTEPDALREKLMVLLRICLQLLGNSTVGNQKNASRVWGLFLDSFSELLLLGDNKVSGYSCMILHSCLMSQLSERVSQLVSTESGCSLLSHVLTTLVSCQQEWGIYIIERCLEHSEFIKNISTNVSTDGMCLICELLVSLLKKQVEQQDKQQVELSTHVAEGNISFIQQDFKSRALGILGLAQSKDMESQETILVTLELDVLCEAVALRGSEGYNTVTDQDLLAKPIHLLHCMHLLGEQSDNEFSNVSKLSQMGTVDDTHPVFGLKRDLIRLIANMVYKHRTNQDKVRDLGGIPLVMNHTTIDGRNPFITQWSIFAIRNLLEDNQENQRVVASLKQEGLADNAQQLREFGVEAEMEGERIVVRDTSDKIDTYPSPGQQ